MRLVRHTARLLLMLSVFGCVVTVGCAAETRVPQRPNILFILTDDQPLSTVAQMPTVQAELGAKGLSFENAFNSDPVCCPSRATILTGRYAHNHGIWVNKEPEGGAQGFRDRGLDQDTIGTRLSAAGYATGFFGKYFNNYNRHDLYVPPGWDRWFAYGGSIGKAGEYQINSDGEIETFRQGETHPTDLVREKAEGFVRAHAGESWFAYVAPKDPHGPYNPPPRHAHAFDGVELPNPPSYDEEDVSDKPSYVRGQSPLSAKRERKLRQLYEDKLEALQTTDDLVAGILATLEETGQLSNTYVFFATDNAYLLGEHRLRSKGKPYEESVRTPLLVRGPGVPAGQIRGNIVANVDLAPTFAELARASPPADADGRSLVPLLAEDSPSSWREALLLENRSEVGVSPDWWGVRTERYVYFEYETGEKELYDLEEDPYQLESIHESADPSLVAELHDRLEKLRSCAGDSCREADGGP